MTQKFGIEQVIDGCHNIMSHVLRYSLAPVIRSENLAEHSAYVAMNADMIAEDLSHSNPELNLDRTKILRFALFHDIEEVGTGDIVHGPKYKSDKLRKELGKVGEIILEEILNKSYGEDSPVANLILNSSKQYESEKYSSLEGRIVKIADLLQSISYCCEEIRMGNAFYFSKIGADVQSQIVKKFGNDPELGYLAKGVQKIRFNTIDPLYSTDNL